MKRPAARWGVGAVAIAFGVLTLVAGGRVLFGGGAAEAGDYVRFVVWFNFLAGFAYVVAGVGLGLAERWGAGLALGLAVATLVVFAAFGVHVLYGGPYEARTVAAMTFRAALWCALAAWGHRLIRRDRYA